MYGNMPFRGREGGEGGGGRATIHGYYPKKIVQFRTKRQNVKVNIYR